MSSISGGRSIKPSVHTEALPAPGTHGSVQQGLFAHIRGCAVFGLCGAEDRRYSLDIIPSMPSCPACKSEVALGTNECPSCGASFLFPTLGLLETHLTEEQEAALPIPKSIPLFLGLLGIGGAAWGLLAVALGASQMQGGAFAYLIIAFMVAMYVFSGYCGVRTLRRQHGWVYLNQLLWAIQVPIIMSPIASYSFSTGGFVTVWLQLLPALRVGGNVWLGSTFTLNLFTPGPTAFGVNLFALGISYYLFRVQRSGASFQPSRLDA